MQDRNSHAMPASHDAAHVRALLHHLRADDPVAEAAWALANGYERHPARMDAVFAALEGTGGADAFTRAAAAWVAGKAEMQADERDAARTLLVGVLQNHDANAQMRRVGATAAIISGIVASFVPALFVARGGGAEILTIMPITAGLAAIVAASVGAALRNQRKSGNARPAWATPGAPSARAEAALALAAIGAVDTVGALAVAQATPVADERTAFERALHTLLPAVGEQHLGILPPPEMQALARLASHADTQLAGKAIGALHHIGTTDIIPALRRQRSGQLTQKVSEAIRAIEERARRQQYGEVLGRATHGPIDPDTLVRPAGSAPVEAEQLLRPSVGGDER